MGIHFSSRNGGLWLRESHSSIFEALPPPCLRAIASETRLVYMRHDSCVTWLEYDIRRDSCIGDRLHLYLLPQHLHCFTNDAYASSFAGEIPHEKLLGIQRVSKPPTGNQRLSTPAQSNGRESECTLVELMVQTKQKRVYWVETPLPRSFLGVMRRGGGLGSSTIIKNLMSPTPRRKWYLTTGRRAH